MAVFLHGAQYREMCAQAQKGGEMGMRGGTGGEIPFKRVFQTLNYPEKPVFNRWGKTAVLVNSFSTASLCEVGSTLFY
jgi:hypothetical protein